MKTNYILFTVNGTKLYRDMGFIFKANSVLKSKVNSLPMDKIVNLSKLKAFADNKINMTKELEFVLGREENIVGKEENSGYQHFPTMFSKAFFSRGVRSQDYVGKS